MSRAQRCAYVPGVRTPAISANREHNTDQFAMDYCDLALPVSDQGFDYVKGCCASAERIEQ